MTEHKAGETLEIRSPWSDHNIKGIVMKETWNGHIFLSLPSSVVAVKDGKAITECVTVKGALRRLKYLEAQDFIGQ